MKYTREVLQEAVDNATSMAGVMRNLGLRQSGGAHAHLRRRIDAFGISTAHFRRAQNAGRPSAKRMSASQLLVLRPEGSKRLDAGRLRRALVELGVMYRCKSCGAGREWMGTALTLHVDHINGDFLDCRRENLRFLCPNCHSQTETYAGRNRRKYGGSKLPHVKRPKDAAWVTTDDDLAEVFGRVDSGEITVRRAVEQIGCSPAHYYRLRQRLTEPGRATARLEARNAARDARDAAIIEFALAHPKLGPKPIAAGLAEWPSGAMRMAHGTVTSVLRKAGLRYRADRETAAKRRSEIERLDSGLTWREQWLV